MLEGSITYFNKKQGYGLIQGEDGVEYFLHIKSILPPGEREQVQEGDRVVFLPGRPQALKVVVENGRRDHAGEQVVTACEGGTERKKSAKT